MNPQLQAALGFALAAAAAMLVIAPQHARADDPTIDSTPFVGTLSRAEVRADYMKHPADHDYDEWNIQHNDREPFKSTLTSQEARASYLRSRDEVRQLTAEDSGSSYFKRTPRNPATMMGAPAR